MNFEDFRTDIEYKLKQIAEFELQEFHYKPYSFGNGMLGYRINGRIHKFIFNGRENELVWEVSKLHEKYSGATFTEINKYNGLQINTEELKKELTAHNKN